MTSTRRRTFQTLRGVCEVTPCLTVGKAARNPYHKLLPQVPTTGISPLRVASRKTLIPTQIGDMREQFGVSPLHAPGLMGPAQASVGDSRRRPADQRQEGVFSSASPPIVPSSEPVDSRAEPGGRAVPPTCSSLRLALCRWEAWRPSSRAWRMTSRS